MKFLMILSVILFGVALADVVQARFLEARIIEGSPAAVKQFP